MASIPFFTPPVSSASRFDPQSFTVLLLRRLWCQLPLCSGTCRCGQPLDSRGHHRGACAHAGDLGRRGFPLESCTAVKKWSPTVFLCSTAHSLPLTPRWSAQCELTEPRRQCAERDGAALDQARRTKERTYPELTCEQGRARLVVLACETGGRWSEEAQSFLRHLARARARSEPREAFASSLLERRGGVGADAEIPSTSDVIWGDRQRGWAELSHLLRTVTPRGLHSFILSQKKKADQNCAGLMRTERDM